MRKRWDAQFPTPQSRRFSTTSKQFLKLPGLHGDEPERRERRPGAPGSCPLHSITRFRRNASASSRFPNQGSSYSGKQPEKWLPTNSRGAGSSGPFTLGPSLSFRVPLGRKAQPTSRELAAVAFSAGLSSSGSYCASNNNEAINTQVKLSRGPPVDAAAASLR